MSNTAEHVEKHVALIFTSYIEQQSLSSFQANFREVLCEKDHCK